MFLLVFLLTLVAATAAQTTPPNVNFMLGCGLYPQVCNNKCYAVFVAGAPQTVTWSGASKAVVSSRRRTAGTVPNPCCANLITAPPVCSNIDGTEVACTSPDEYPYASTNEYGNGPGNGPTSIRCTGIEENEYEGLTDYNRNTLIRTIADGGCGRTPGCRITIGFEFVDIRS